jgi:hypothetical protein
MRLGSAYNGMGWFSGPDGHDIGALFKRQHREFVSYRVTWDESNDEFFVEKLER